jgi:hypothetical protein
MIKKFSILTDNALLATIVSAANTWLQGYLRRHRIDEFY